MTGTLLDFSQRRELGLHASVTGAVQAAATPLGIPILIVGAFARDLHLLYGHGVKPTQQTHDIDFALSVSDWKAFQSLKSALIATGDFAESKSAQRIHHRNKLPVDLVPFGKVESRDRKIAWPPDGDVVMDVFGFKEALSAAQDVLLPGNVETKVVSLPALALLKIVCWQDRHFASPRKDAQDLYLILRNYLDAGNANRLWDEFNDWTQEDGFDTELAGARMLGHDVRLILDNKGTNRIGEILVDETQSSPTILDNEMNPADPGRARALLGAMLRGLDEGLAARANS